jgi:hypothetical protein
VAYYDQDTWWCAHKKFGLWFALRGVVTFELPFVPGSEPALPEPIITQEEKEEIKRWTEQAMQEGWTNFDTMLKIRNACATGYEHRYEGLLLDYFYPINTTRQVILEKILTDNQ